MRFLKQVGFKQSKQAAHHKNTGKLMRWLKTAREVLLLFPGPVKSDSVANGPLPSLVTRLDVIPRI